MAVRQRVISGLYRDSVSLMQCASKVEALPGVEQAGAMMATPANLDLAREAGMLGDDETIEAGPNDLLLLVKGDAEDSAQAAFEEAERILMQTRAESTGETAEEHPPASIRMALDKAPDARLALISTPGEYAASEAMKALKLGLDAMIFSDNVSVADEMELKQLAHERGLLVMGPDCGTAIVGGLPLGFANVVRGGSIGCVGASGTGLQQVTALIDRWGSGITHALGTGSHDLSDEIGGVSMIDAIRMLAADGETRVLLLVSKPPSPAVMERVLDAAAESGMPVVACFLGADEAVVTREGVQAARTLEDAAALAVQAATGEVPLRPAETTALEDAATKAAAALAPGQRFVRGLFAGGTFSYEAALLLSEKLEAVASNTPAGGATRSSDPWTSEGHTVIDLGDDEFTRGRPHPMIDQRLRLERLAREAADPEVAVVLLDVVLGYGAHPDPAAELAPAVKRAAEKAAADGRAVAFVASVCGTAGDPQGLESTERQLADTGVLLADSNARAVRLAMSIIEGR